MNDVTQTGRIKELVIYNKVCYAACRLESMQKTRKLTPCKYKHNFCCLKLPHYSRCCCMYIVLTNFTNAWKAVKEVSFGYQELFPISGKCTPKPSGQIDDIFGCISHQCPLAHPS